MQTGRLFYILAISTPHVRRRRKGLGGVYPRFQPLLLTRTGVRGRNPAVPAAGSRRAPAARGRGGRERRQEAQVCGGVGPAARSPRGDPERAGLAPRPPHLPAEPPLGRDSRARLGHPLPLPATWEHDRREDPLRARQVSELGGPGSRGRPWPPADATAGVARAPRPARPSSSCARARGPAPCQAPCPSAGAAARASSALQRRAPGPGARGICLCGSQRRPSRAQDSPAPPRSPSPEAPPLLRTPG